MLFLGTGYGLKASLLHVFQQLFLGLWVYDYVVVHCTEIGHHFIVCGHLEFGLLIEYVSITSRGKSSKLRQTHPGIQLADGEVFFTGMIIHPVFTGL